MGIRKHFKSAGNTFFTLVAEELILGSLGLLDFITQASQPLVAGLAPLVGRVARRAYAYDQWWQPLMPRHNLHSLGSTAESLYELARKADQYGWDSVEWSEFDLLLWKLQVAVLDLRIPFPLDHYSSHCLRRISRVFRSGCWNS